MTNIKLMATCVSQRLCLLKDVMSNASVYCCSFHCCPLIWWWCAFLCYTLVCDVIGQVPIDRKHRIHSMHWLWFSAIIKHSSHQPDSSILALVSLVSFIVATAMLTLKEDQHVFQCILLPQSENYFSLCSLVMVV